MRKYNKEGAVALVKCNMCGKDVLVKNNIIKEGVFVGRCTWGYFSGKDGEKHSFDLCEECYDKMVKNFAIPLDIKENTEII